VADLLHHLGSHQKEYPRAPAFLWTLDARDIVGCHTGAVTEEELEEMARLVVMLLLESVIRCPNGTISCHLH
jgi:hypothetical protein